MVVSILTKGKNGDHNVHIRGAYNDKTVFC